MFRPRNHGTIHSHILPLLIESNEVLKSNFELKKWTLNYGSKDFSGKQPQI